MILGETLLGLLWEDAGAWLPSGTVDTLIAGGTTDVSYGRALALAVLYLVLAVVASLTILARRDVTD